MSLSLYPEYRGKSLGEILDQNRGVGLGFDLLRLGLALMILLSHTSGIIGLSGLKTEFLNWLFGIDAEVAAQISKATTDQLGTGSGQANTGLGRPFSVALLPMFFALSGFLVAGSAFRTKKLIQFLGLRVLRIVPALAVEVFLSAMILGAVFTTLPLDQYFSSTGFWMYWLNIIGEVQFFLPGVFEQTSTNSVVNANLWTLPWELVCYILMSAFIVIGLLKHPRLFLGLLGIATIGLIVANTFYGVHVAPEQLPGPVISYYFVVGVAFYLFRYKIVFSEIWFLACVLITYPLMLLVNTVYIYPIFLAYITIYIGLFPFPQFKLLKSGDYSYGIYLYGYPVTQALVAAIPSLKDSILLASVYSVALTCLFAAFSWHAVEKHCLKLKRYIAPRSAKLEAAHHPAVNTAQ